ncbi:MAG TPA: phosphatidate cytidylyltransferase [Burkholderiaceae bacterium]|nr:phosphatidate cytidylyltransferase [Burkholderiaceae bacterium]
MLKQRVITAVVLLVLLVGALAWSALAFELLATVIVAAALGEWMQLVGWPRAVAVVGAAVFGIVLLFIALAAPAWVEWALLPLAVLATIVWGALAMLLLQADAMALRLPRGASTGLAVVLTAAAWVALVHFLLEGVAVLFSVLVIVWLADTAAYFAGRAFGRRKLAPHISPGKTWAGVVGAIVAVIAVALIARQVAPDVRLLSNLLLANLGVAGAILLAAVVMVSIAGDLFESLLKRQAGVKDSSRLLPGHGGFYDRVDALLPALPLAALLEWIAR